MEARQHKNFIPLNKGLVTACLLVFVGLMTAWTGDTIPTGPYQFNYPANFGNRTFIPDDNPTTKEGVYLGRLLFYETALSANNKISCGTCHQQALAFTDGKAFSTGVDGTLTTRSSMTLANMLWSRRFFWDGRSNALEGQAAIPMQNPHEMGQMMQTTVRKLSRKAPYPELFDKVFGKEEGINGVTIIKAIAQFERTLISADSKYDQYLQGKYKPTNLELQGMQLFDRAPQPAKSIRGANCSRCHGGVKNYMELFHNNGLDTVSKDAGIGALTGQAGDQGRFKAPTLRNIALTAPYMHDGRFKTLDEVLDHYSDHIKTSPALSDIFRGASNQKDGKQLLLKANEKKAIVAFLNMLTDDTFIHDPRFSDPHITAAISNK